jgi:uncharacterized protein (TIGR02646 family)
LRSIRKGAEPQQLTAYRSKDGGTYANYPDKQALRAALVAEQRGLCCYCMGRIQAEPGRMKIEHWKSQDACSLGDPQDALRYWNLLGACLGGEGQPARSQHCDTSKGNLPLRRNPADPLDYPIIAGLRYLGNGAITSDDAQFQDEIDRVLQLNKDSVRLKTNRLSVLNGFVAALGKTGEVRQAQLKQWLREWSGEDTVGELPEYCEVVVYWLRKRQRSAN